MREGERSAACATGERRGGFGIVAVMVLMVAAFVGAAGRGILAPAPATAQLPGLASGAAASADPAPYIARIEARQQPDRGGLDGFSIEELMQRFGVPGVSVAVIRDFDIHWAKGYGVADAASGVAVDTGTMFQAASISKPIAAMAAMRLVQDGRLDLDADINGVLKSWGVPRNGATGELPVTARVLFSHTSGADDGFGFPGYAPGAPTPTLVQILNGERPSNVGEVRFARPPYQAYKYSGGGTTIMQLALTELTGEPFERLMHELVLGPLGMTSSTYAQPLPASHHARAARAHDGRGRNFDVPWHVYPEQAAAGLWTTPSDLARVIIEVQRARRAEPSRVLDQGSALTMTSPVGVGPFAVGFDIERQGEGWYFGHGGSNHGFRGIMRGHVSSGYGVVVMTNANNGGQVAAEIVSRVASAYDWDSLHKPLLR